MSEIQNLHFEEDGQIYEIQIESNTPMDEETSQPSQPTLSKRRSMGIKEDTVVKLREARQLIRFYTKYALGAFKDFSAAEIEEVTLSFGIKMGGKTGIPYITQGSVESNLSVQVKCKFPKTS